MDAQATRALQTSLLEQGYPLPRWGADGSYGAETSAALASWLRDHPKAVAKGASLDLLAEAVLRHGKAAAEVVPGDRVLDVRELHPGKARKGFNPWTRIDTICLHQMACEDGRTDWKRWKDLAIHFAVLLHGQAAWLYDPNVLVIHGHGWNHRSVGLEIEGRFAGVASRPETLWHMPDATVAERTPMVPPAEQVEAAKQSIRLAVAIVNAHGGKVKYIGAHRQSYGEKESDPGELIWKAVALPMMVELGLSSAPTLKGGKPIPQAWDPAQAGVPY